MPARIIISTYSTCLENLVEYWSQSDDHELQRRRCKNLQHKIAYLISLQNILR
jgi:hypothetical protein